MSQTFHSKYHRANHMTLKDPNLPDAGWDPIASEEVPFSGDFWMAGDSAIHSNYIKPATGTSITVDSATFTLSGDANFANTMTVVGDTYLNSTLTVTGQTHLLDNLIVDKDVNIAQNLGVGGYEYISGKNVNGYGLTVDNKIYARGLDILGNLIIDGNCYTTRETTASIGKFHETSAQSATADVLYVTKHLSAVSATFHNIDITASESSGFIIAGAGTIPSNYYEIPVMSPVPAHSNLWLDKAGLMVDGWTILSGDVKMERDLGVYGDVTLSGNTVVNTLNVTGAVDFDDTLNVDGATTLKSLTVTNHAEIGGTLGVTGDANVKGNVNFNSTLNVTGDTNLRGDLIVENKNIIITNRASNNASISSSSIGFIIGGAIPGSMDVYTSYSVGSIQVSGRENPSTGTISTRTFDYPIIGGTLATETYVNDYVSDVIGNINAVLDEINGEEI